jgi:putative transposase
MKFRVVEDCRDTWSVQALCRVLGISTAGYYAWRSRPDSKRTVEDHALLVDIRQVHADSGGRYGSPRVHAALRAHGKKAGRGRIERLMRRHGIRGLVAPRRRVQTTDSRHPFPIAPNLLDRNFSATTKPNAVWLADLTYIATSEGGAAKGSACAARGMAAEVGFTWPPSWTGTRARSWVGACVTILGLNWRRRRC